MESCIRTAVSSSYIECAYNALALPSSRGEPLGSVVLCMYIGLGAKWSRGMYNNQIVIECASDTLQLNIV